MNPKESANVFIVACLVALVGVVWWRWPTPPPMPAPGMEPAVQVRPTPVPRTRPPPPDVATDEAPVGPQNPGVNPVSVLQVLAQAQLAIQQQATDMHVKNNLRQVAMGAEQYFLENGVSSVAFETIVGTNSSQYVKGFDAVDGEEYSAVIVLGAPVTAYGISGARTITYGP